MRMLYGVLAAYASPEALTNGLRAAREVGYTNLEIFTPYPVEEANELLPTKGTPMGWIVLTGGILGGLLAVGLQLWAALGYPLDVGGRPLISWPAYVPVTFELTILFSALVGAGGLVWLLRFPQLHHPVFSDQRFRRASQDQFFLCLRCGPTGWDQTALRKLLAQSAAESIEEVYR